VHGIRSGSMASTATGAASREKSSGTHQLSALPAKKRKSSNASSNTNDSRMTPHESEIPTTSLDRQHDPVAIKSLPIAAVSEDSTVATGNLLNRNRKGSIDSSEKVAKSLRKASQDSSELSPSRLPSKKRKGSYDAGDKKRRRSGSADAHDALRKGSHDSSSLDTSRKRKSSVEESLTSVTFNENAVRQRKGSQDSSTFEWTRKSSDATSGDFKLPDADDLLNIQGQGSSGGEGKQPADSILQQRSAETEENFAALDHLDALGPAVPGSPAKLRKGSDADNSGSAGSLASSGQRLLLEAIMMTTNASQSYQSGGSGHTSSNMPSAHAPAAASSAFARERLESWGGMSDLSIPHQPHDEDGRSSGNKGFASVPSRISLNRERLNSIASLSEVDVSMPLMFPINDSGSGTGANASGASLLDNEGMVVVPASDIQAYVAAAVASVGEQLAELAGAVEAAADVDDGSGVLESENSSVASPLIGAVSDGAGRGRGGRHSVSKAGGNRPRSLSASSGKVAVDYEAVQAAVDAAQAATGTLDLSAISQGVASSSTGTVGTDKKPRARRKLPLSKTRNQESDDDEDLVDSALSKKEIASLRARARAATQSNAPSTAKSGASHKKIAPLKKRGRRSPPEPDEIGSSTPPQTPRVSNKKKNLYGSDGPRAPLTTSANGRSTGSKGPAGQKWDKMYECLLEFAEERKSEETKGMSQEERSKWNWDGNVPTTYKTKDGKPLGRWVNNQRTAKGKGTLKEEREELLIKAGLKWSVLTSNSWNEMLDELRHYVTMITKDGEEWDGNVPTNYQIKTRPDSQFQGEDKNLGRWVNRQRSMYQAGRLREDRQAALESLGLRWSMLATTSWDSMFETLCIYVEEQKKGGKSWDGNVPANYKTKDDPPRALGRWINRQRSAFVKKKLKKEYIDKLNSIGLKWSVHERANGALNDSEYDQVHDADEPPSKTESV